MKRKWYLIILFCLLGSTLYGNGGDDRMGPTFWFESRILGFSADGRYVAFLFHGYHGDGVARPYFRAIHIIDVDKNDYVAKPLSLTSQTAFPEASDSGLIAWADSGMKWKIDHAIKGKEAELKRTAYGFYQFATFQTDSGEYDVRLETLSTGEFYESRDLKMFELVLMKGDRNKVLQRDSRLPKSRQTPGEYGIKSVHLYQGKVVVFIEYINLKEGRFKHIMVSGTLDFDGR